MRGDISGNTNVTGANMMLVLVALILLMSVCVADFSLRWVQWCNMSEAPLAQAAKNIALLCAGGFAITMSATGFIRSKYIWQVLLLYTVFFCAIPTAVFFSQYLAANALLAVALCFIFRLKNSSLSRVNILLASFLIGLAMWWVPAIGVFMAVIYMGIVLFCPQDIRSWLVPVVGLASAGIIITTYRMFFLGEMDFLANMTWTSFFAMPYTEKIFKSYNFYFYVSIIGAISFVAYMKYIRMASNDTLPEKKISMLLSTILLCAVAVVFIVPKSRYMVVFFSLPFALIMSKYYTQYSSPKWGVFMRWVMLVMAVFSLWLFK